MNMKKTARNPDRTSVAEAFDKPKYQDDYNKRMISYDH